MKQIYFLNCSYRFQNSLFIIKNANNYIIIGPILFCGTLFLIRFSNAIYYSTDLIKSHYFTSITFVFNY